MNPTRAWEVLFAQEVPKNVDFDEAVSALDGIEEVDPAITLTPEVLDRAEEYLTDAPTFVEANITDPRAPHWKRHAESIGETVGADPATNTTTAPATPEPKAPTTSLSASALISANVGGSAGPSLGGFALATPARTVKADPDDPEPKPERKTRRKGRERDVGDDKEEERERKKEPSPPPKPLILLSRDIPAITQRILAHETYVVYRTWIVSAFEVLRTGTDPDKSRELADTKRYLGTLLNSTESLIPMISAHLLDLIRTLETRRDVSEPDWFTANYITGQYPPPTTA